MLTIEQSYEWMSAIRYFATHNCLPDLLSAVVAEEIVQYPDEWEQDVRLERYARVMEATERRYM